MNMLKETVNYTNWASNKTNQNNSVNCVAMDNNGDWHAVGCGWSTYALCSQIYTGKCLECQFKEDGWLTNHQSISVKPRYYVFDSLMFYR